MSLAEKISNISGAIKEEKISEMESKQNEALEPVRAKIKDLEKKKFNLEMLKNSLDYKREKNDDGLGMKEYSSQVSGAKEKHAKKLEKIIVDNPEAMEKLEVKDINDLVDNEELNKEEEIVNYKESVKENEGLQLSDEQLKKRLADLGVEMGEEDFSYELASQKIDNSLEELNNELAIEQLKTPEGRNEVINNLAEDFSASSKDIYNLSLEKNNQQKKGSLGEVPDYFVDINLKDKKEYQGKKVEIEILKDQAVIPGYSGLKLLPSNFQENVDKFGLDVAQEALLLTYEGKLDSSLVLDKLKNERNLLEAVSPKKRQEVITLFQEFDSKRQEMGNLLNRKSEELKEKNLDFDPNNPKGYKVNYSYIFSLSTDGTDNQIMRNFNEICPANSFPEYDYEQMAAIIQERVSEIEKAIKVVENINDQEGINKFLDYDDDDNQESVAFFAGQSHSGRVNFSKNANFRYGKESEKVARDLSNRFPSYEEATKYLDAEITEKENVKEKISKTLSEALKYEYLESQLVNSAYGKNIYELDRSVKDIETEKKDAESFLLAIADIELKIPKDEDLEVSGEFITSITKQNKYKELKIELDNKLNIKHKAKDKLNEQERSEPFFGKSKWRDKNIESEKEIAKLEDELKELKQKYDEAVKESGYNINVSKIYSYGKANDLFKKNNKSGKSDEIFKELKEELTKLSTQKLPEDVAHIYEELKSLSKKISARE